MADIRALVAAAGEGRRSGLPYPKTLHEVSGRPILGRILELLRPIDPVPAVIVSPSGRPSIESFLTGQNLDAVLIEQQDPTGMGDAVRQVRQSPDHLRADHLVLMWGDVPFIEPETLKSTIEAHIAHGNVLTFPTRQVDMAYTIVERDRSGHVLSLIETREAGIQPEAGERDIGLFVFRPGPVLDLLEERPAGAIGKHTGEHGFLYLVRHLVRRGMAVEALPIATERETLSLNRLTDLEPDQNRSLRP